MPFRAIRGEEVVWPDEAERDDSLICPACGDPFTVVSGHSSASGWRSRHFRHYRGTDCGGPETDTHKLMKYVASRTCYGLFDDVTVEREAALDDGRRRVDVLVTFDEPHPVHCRGVAVEVQHKNTSKDKLAVSIEYLNAGYSVVWLDESDFTDDWQSVELAPITTAWPNAVPHEAEWRARPAGTVALESHSPTTYPIEATLPPSYITDIEPKLETRWRVGAEEYYFDIERELSAHNADRTCAVCGDPADYYLFQSDVMSECRCSAHHPAKMNGDAA